LRGTRAVGSEIPIKVLFTGPKLSEW